MKIIYNNLIPFKGYKAINLFGLVFVRKGAKFTEVDYNHEHIHSKQMAEMLWVIFLPLVWNRVLNHPLFF